MGHPPKNSATSGQICLTRIQLARPVNLSAGCTARKRPPFCVVFVAPSSGAYAKMGHPPKNSATSGQICLTRIQSARPVKLSAGCSARKRPPFCVVFVAPSSGAYAKMGHPRKTVQHRARREETFGFDSGLIVTRFGKPIIGFPGLERAIDCTAGPAVGRAAFNWRHNSTAVRGFAACRAPHVDIATAAASVGAARPNRAGFRGAWRAVRISGGD
jgi:hypothetical protein